MITRLFIASAISSGLADSAGATVLGGSARGDSTFTVQGIAILAGLFVSVVTLLMNQRKVRRENEADGKAAKDEILSEVRDNRRSEEDRFREIEGRVRAAETRMERFVPGDVIDGKIEHLKTNRVQIELRHEEKLKEITDCITEQGKQIAKMEERHHGMADSMGEMKQLLKEMGLEMKAGFKELTEQQRRTV